MKTGERKIRTLLVLFCATNLTGSMSANGLSARPLSIGRPHSISPHARNAEPEIRKVRFVLQASDMGFTG